MTAAVLSARSESAPPVLGILGDGRVHRSRSPALFTRVMAHVGLKGACETFQVASQDLGTAVARLKTLRLFGAQVGAPYKEKVAGHLDVLSEGAQIIGAVNTIVSRKGILKGYNTNAIGIMEALDEQRFAVAGKRAIVFGTGGAARAAVFILIWLRAAEVRVAGRDPEAAARLAKDLGGTAGALEDLADAARGAQIVINATAVSSPDEAPELARIVSALPLNSCQLVFDLNPARRDNFWQAAAAGADCAFTDGLNALACQARRSFFLWTGFDVPKAEFFDLLRP